MTHTRPLLTARATVVAGLAAVAVVHWRLAPARDLIGEVFTQGDLFRLQAVIAAVLAAAVLARPSLPVWGAAASLGGLSLLAVVATTYVAVPAAGPFPRMFEPVWYADKLVAAAAAGLVLASSCVGLVLAEAVPRRAARPPSAHASRP